MQALVDLLREADYWAGAAGRATSSARRTCSAPSTRRSRARDRVRGRMQEEIAARHACSSTPPASRVGQVNGLSVVQLGGFAFGMPHRITARVRLGGGSVVDIEREAELGGPIHSKGVLILSGFLAGPLRARASRCRSPRAWCSSRATAASRATAPPRPSCTRCSRRSPSAPIRQSLAVTGSVNQHGDVQAIGGVNEKIEGFFDLCAARAA